MKPIVKPKEKKKVVPVTSIMKKQELQKEYDSDGEEVGEKMVEVDTVVPIGLGMHWGNLDVGTAYRSEMEIPKKMKAKAPKEICAFHDELEYLKDYARTEKKKMMVKDAKVQSFDFFTVAEEGYHRNLSELTLHQVLRFAFWLLYD